MTRRLCAAVLLAVAACRQIAGLDDRPATHDGGAPVVTAPPDEAGSADAAPAVTFCTGVDAALCDDFEGVDAGWSFDFTTGAGPIGALFVGDQGQDSAHSLHVTSVDNDAGGFRNNRLLRTVDPTSDTFELSFSVWVDYPMFPGGDGELQLVLTLLPGTNFYPVLEADGGLVFTWQSADGGYERVLTPVEAPFIFGHWNRFVLTIDAAAGTVHGTIDGKDAVSGTYAPVSSTGAYTVAVGLRSQDRTFPVNVRYDDVVVRFR